MLQYKLMIFSKNHKRVLAVIILAVTIGAFIYYVVQNPAVIRQLGQTNPWLLVGLIAGYGVFTLAIAAVQGATLRLIKIRLPILENILLTSYSSIANFFGPLQSGPGVRLAYLKARYNISLKRFTLATILYFGFFAFVSGFMLTAGALAWWQTLLVLAVISAGARFVIQRKRKQAGRPEGFGIVPIAWLGIATVLQLVIISLIYFAELRSIDGSISYSQALTYTGAANFALFVSITPGAIGFRESFLLFTQQLHNIPQQQVLAASLLDRAANIAFLGLLFLVTLGLHAQKRFSVKQKAAPKPGE